jgi:nicotinate phosphoribosyltransferase
MTELLEPPMPKDPQFSGLQTDLYELTMAAGYRKAGFDARATFELFVRGLPARRNFLVAAGLAQALAYLERINFSHDEIGYLRRHPMFSGMDEEFSDFLANFRFSGEVWAVPEGTVIFPDEPILRVTAPIAEAQIVETYLLSAIHFQRRWRTSRGGIRHAARAWSGSRHSGRASRVHRGMRRDIERRRGLSLRRPYVWHAGALLDHGV